MPVHPLTARVLGPAVVCIVVSMVAWAPGISDDGLVILSAQAQRAQKSPTEQLRSQVETLINRLRGRDMPEGIVKSNGRIEATQVDVAAKYPGRLATLTVDEGIRFNPDLAKMASLKTVFKENGTVTAANASQISDGAAAVVLAAEDVAQRRGWKPLARIVGQAGAAMAPEWFTIAPAQATKRLLEKVGWRKEDVDLFEINEAFSAVVLGVCRDLGISLDRVNVHGGAVALGHPIGCSGARILTTLLYAMPRYEARRGVAAICLAGGEAVAVAVERL